MQWNVYDHYVNDGHRIDESSGDHCANDDHRNDSYDHRWLGC